MYGFPWLVYFIGQSSPLLYIFLYTWFTHCKLYSTHITEVSLILFRRFLMEGKQCYGRPGVLKILWRLSFFIKKYRKTIMELSKVNVELKLFSFGQGFLFCGTFIWIMKEILILFGIIKGLYDLHRSQTKGDA